MCHSALHLRLSLMSYGITQGVFGGPAPKGCGSLSQGRGPVADGGQVQVAGWGCACSQKYSCSGLSGDDEIMETLACSHNIHVSLYLTYTSFSPVSPKLSFLGQPKQWRDLVGCCQVRVWEQWVWKSPSTAGQGPQQCSNSQGEWLWVRTLKQRDVKFLNSNNNPHIKKTNIFTNQLDKVEKWIPTFLV